MMPVFSIYDQFHFGSVYLTKFILRVLSATCVEYIVGSFSSGGKRQSRMQPAPGGPVRRGQTPGRGETHHQENYQRHPEGAKPQKHSRNR